MFFYPRVIITSYETFRVAVNYSNFPWQAFLPSRCSFRTLEINKFVLCVNESTTNVTLFLFMGQFPRSYPHNCVLVYVDGFSRKNTKRWRAWFTSGNKLNYKKLDHCIMGFDWLSGHGIWAIIPCPRSRDHKLFCGCSWLLLIKLLFHSRLLDMRWL